MENDSNEPFVLAKDVGGLVTKTMEIYFLNGFVVGGVNCLDFNNTLGV